MSARKNTTPAGNLRVLGYVRVSTSDQADSGAGLTAQRQAIKAAADQRGWRIVRVIDDAGLSAKSLDRPGLTDALAMIESGKADALVVAKLDRLSRSLLDFATLMERSRRKGWAIVALDLGVDTTTPAGEMMANVLATFSQFERRLIGQRTKEALAVKRAEGVILGRPRLLEDKHVRRIVTMRKKGMSLAAIANFLTTDGVPTSQGGARWYPSTVNHVLGYASK
jgi:DNA invertase Pin-like site-specific DNA recombinase